MTLHERRRSRARSAARRSEASFYSIANQRGISKAIPFNLGGYLKQAPIRETATRRSSRSREMIDELAYAAGMDPIEFRLQNMSAATNSRDMDPLVRGRAGVAKWETRSPPRSSTSGNVVHGRGVALGPRKTRRGVVAEIEVNKKTGQDHGQAHVRRAGRRPRDQPGPRARTRWSGSLIQTVEPRDARGA